MKSNPRLIPRLNVEYGIADFFLTLDYHDPTIELSEAVHRRWPGYGPLFVDSGRTALSLCLRALGLGRGSRVGVPLYTCEAVFEAIAKAGCTLVFLDVDPRFYTVNPDFVRKEVSDLDAIVPVHVFGQPSDVESLRLIDNRVRIIEDCAHALGTQVSGKMAGTFGDASFFSFRLGKVVSAGNAGMLLLKGRELFESAHEIWEALPARGALSGTAEALSSFGRATLYRRPWFGLFSLPIGSIFDSRLDFMEKTGFEARQAYSGTLRVLASRLLGLEARVATAQRNATLFREAIKSAGFEPPSEAPWGRHSYYQFAVRFPSELARDRAAAVLAEHGVDSIRFYHDSPSVAARRYGYEVGTCPAAEAIAQTVLTVPCHPFLRPTDLQTIANSLEDLGNGS